MTKSIPTKRQVTDLERAAQEVEADMDFWTRNADPQDVLRRCVARIRALAPAQSEGWGNAAIRRAATKAAIELPHMMFKEREDSYVEFAYRLLAPSPPSPAPKDTDGQSGLSTSPSNEGDAGRPGQTDSSVLPEDQIDAFFQRMFGHWTGHPKQLRGFISLIARDALRQSAARLQAELEEAKRGEESMTKMCDAYVTENQQLSDRVEAAERTVGELRELLGTLHFQAGTGHIPRETWIDVDAALAPRET